MVRKVRSQIWSVFRRQKRKSFSWINQINPDGWSTGFSDAKKKGYSGVAIYSKNPLNVSKSFGFEEADNEGRFIQFDFENFSIVSVYFPWLLESRKTISKVSIYG